MHIRQLRWREFPVFCVSTKDKNQTWKGQNVICLQLSSKDSPLDNFEFLWIKSSVLKDFMAEYGRLICLNFLCLKKESSSKVRFLNIYKIACYLYCPLSGVLPLPTDFKTIRESLLFRHLALHTLNVWLFFCFPFSP